MACALKPIPTPPVLMRRLRRVVFTRLSQAFWTSRIHDVNFSLPTKNPDEPVYFILNHIASMHSLSMQHGNNNISLRNTMPHSEQREMISTLRDYEHKMSRDELEDYQMFVKRHKDDEELDKQSMDRLRELYTKYYINRPRKPFKDPFSSRE